MDTTFVYNFPKITQSDTITAVVSNFPAEINFSGEVMHVYDSLQTQLSIQNSKIDSLYSLISQRGVDGWGIDQIVAIVSIPLIIAIFAFTLPLLSNATSKIEKIYQSKAILDKLNKSLQLRVYVCALIVSVISLIVMMFFPISQNVLVKALPYITAFLVLSVLLFFGKVRQFEKPYWVVDQLEEWYKSESQKTRRKSIIREKRWSVITWFHRKDAYYQQMYKTVKNFNNSDPFYAADRTYYERMYALLRIAVNTDDIELLYAIKSKWYEKIEQSKIRSFKQEDSTYWHFNYSSELFDFHAHAISLLGQCSEPRYQDAAISSLRTTFNHSLLPWQGDVMHVLRALVFLPRETGATFVGRYFSKASWIYRSIRLIPQISYVCGENISSKKERENDCKREWKWIMNIHFLLAAYWWNKGGFEVLSSTCPKKVGKNYGDIFPVCGADVLYHYVLAMDAIGTTMEGISEWEIGELFDISPDEMRTIVAKYATFLMYYTARRENTYHPEAMEQKVLDKTDAFISEIIKLVEDKQVLKALEAIHFNITGIPIVKQVKSAYKLLIQDIQEDEYKKRINQSTFARMQQSLSNSMQLIRTSHVEGICRLDNSAFPDEISMNRCSFSMDKPFFTKRGITEESIWQICHSINRILINRYMYVWRKAVEQMNSKEIVCDVLHFNEQLLKYTKGKKEEYVLVSFDSPIETLMHPHMFKEIMWCAYDNVHFSYCDKTKLFVENDSVIYVIRKEDMPALRYESGYTQAECSIEDESSLKDGELVVRFEIDPHLVVGFNKSAEILKIRHKRTRI